MRAHHPAGAQGPLRRPSEEGMPERIVHPILDRARDVIGGDLRDGEARRGLLALPQ